MYTVKEIYGDNIPKPKPPPKSLPENYLYYDYCGFSCIYPNKLTVTRNIPMLAIKSTPEKLYPDTVLLLYEKTERQFKARMNNKLESIKYGENHKEMFEKHYSKKTIRIGDCQYAWKGKEILFYDYDSSINKYCLYWYLFLETNNRYFPIYITNANLSSLEEVYESEAIWLEVLNSFNLDSSYKSFVGPKKTQSPEEISPYYYLEEELYGNNIPAPNPPPKSLPANYLYYSHCGFSCIYPSGFTVNCNFPELEIILFLGKIDSNAIIISEETESIFKDSLERDFDMDRDYQKDDYFLKTIRIGDCQYAWKGKEILFYDYDSYTNKYSFNWNLFLEANNRYFLVNISLESLSSVKEIYEGEAIWCKVLNSFVLDPNSKSFIRP